MLLALPLLAASCSKDNSVVSTSNDYCYIKSVMLGTVKRQVGTISTSFVGSYYEMTVNLRNNTIENRAENLPDELDTRGYAFGCDICQSVCPYNRQAPSAYHLDDERKAQLEALPDADEAVFRRFAKHSALSRIKYPQWQRNINKSRR